MSSDSARSPEDVGTGAPCPLEIFNEFQMDIQDPGPGSTPCLQACSQLKPGSGSKVVHGGPGAPSLAPWESGKESQTCRRPND